MNKLPSETDSWTKSFLVRLESTPHKHADIALCVPFTHLLILCSVLADSDVKIGAQDVSAHEEGAYTGEVSAAMLANLRTHYVIVGHSERREYHQEGDALVRDKVKAVQAQNMVPIVCIGEQLEEREAGKAREVVLGQLRGSLEGISVDKAERLVIAYEPVWAIGTGKTATADDAQEMCEAIRETLREIQPEHAEGIRVLYGGSIKPDNAQEIFSQSDVDGGLVGGASLKVDSLADIVKASQ